MNILQLFKPITSFVIDFEGCMCGGLVSISNAGAVHYTINTRDMYAIEQALTNDYKIFFFSRYTHNMVLLQTETLPVFVVGNIDRKEKLQQLSADGLLDLSTTLYIGGDMPDVAAMQLAGFACAGADAPYEVKYVTRYISPVAGGSGMVRDVIEKVLKINHRWNG